MNQYLSRYAFQSPKIVAQPSAQTGLIIVIPCHCEPNLITTLESVFDCETPNCDVAIITVINASEKSLEAIKRHNKTTFEEAVKWLKNHSRDGLHFHFLLENNLPKKHAGVGLARKIGMDEAVARFESINKPNGIIVCLDADTTCEKNYLIEIEKHFQTNPASPGCSIHYEHPINGNGYELETYRGIAEYELHLHCFVEGMRYARHPHAFHTIGSAMAVRSWAYQKQGGMNKRKAGEDFYFLQKIISLGHFTELKTTKVIPSPRISERVPFGTGKAMQEWQRNKAFKTYHHSGYEALKSLLEKANSLFNANDSAVKTIYDNLPEPIKLFFPEKEFLEKLNEINRNSTNLFTYQKRFYAWIDIFTCMKFLHYFRDNFQPNVSVKHTTKWLLNGMGKEVGEKSEMELLGMFRRL